MNLYLAAPSIPFLLAEIQVTVTMDAIGEEIRRKHSKLYVLMRNFGPVDFDEVSIDDYQPHINDFNELFIDFITSLEEFCRKFKDEMGNETHAQWLTLENKVESDVRSYKQSLKVKIAEIRREVLARNPAPLPFYISKFLLLIQIQIRCNKMTN